MLKVSLSCLYAWIGYDAVCCGVVLFFMLPSKVFEVVKISFLLMAPSLQIGGA